MQRFLIAMIAIAAISSDAAAHAPVTASLGTGLLHPLTGADHLLAMIAVGIWAAQSGGRAIWVWPISFVLIMICGSTIATAGYALPFVEPGILTSILVLGLMIAFAAKLHIAAGSCLIGMFALLHGYIHASPLPLDTSIGSYLLGLAVGTTALHLTGIGVAGMSKRIATPWLTQAIGALTFLAGFGLLITHA